MTRAATILVLVTLTTLSGCRTRTHCKNEGDCPDGYSCNHATEQCEPDPCFNLPAGAFLRCDGDTLVQCDGNALEEPVECGAPGCNAEAGRCNLCPPEDARCEGDTLVTCDATGLVEERTDCPMACTPTGCAATCGNGTVDPGEACDDGNTTDGDGCSADCLSDESCGNGIVDPDEACDDGNTTGGDGCSADCLSDESCGNGIVDPDEACDDGNTTDGDGCSADCLSDESCGNGIVDFDAGEECEDTSSATWDGCEACLVTDVQVNSTIASGQFMPAVAAAPDGRFVVVWVSSGQDGDGYGVFGQRYQANGQPSGPEFQVNAYTTGGQSNPDVAMADDGRFVVVWHSRGLDGSLEGIIGQRFAPDGQPDGSEFIVNTTTQGSQMYPSVSMAGDGRFVVAWEGPGAFGNGNEIYAQSFTVTGLRASLELLVNTTVEDSQTVPDVSMNDDGYFVVVWQQGIGTNGTGVSAQRYIFPDQRDGAEISVGNHSGSESPRVATRLDRSFVVTWAAWEDPSFSSVHARRYSSTGSALGPAIQVNTYTDLNQWRPDVALLDSDGFVVAWASLYQDSDSFGVYLQRFDSLGAMAGVEQRVNNYVLGLQTNPVVANVPGHGFITAYESNGPAQDGDGSGVFLQRFTAAGAPLGNAAW